MSGIAQVNRWPAAPATLLGLGLLALVGGCAAALVGLPALYALIVLSVIVVFTALVERYPTAVICASIVLLGLFPFSWGIETHVVPKFFGDEALPVLYLLVLPFLYLGHRRRWHSGFGWFYFVLIVFLMAESLSLVEVGHDLVALRNFIETFVLGPMLAVLVLQEARITDLEKIGDAVVWVTVVIAALSIVEKIVQWNPIMQHVTEITYLSPTLARITGGVYRPYVTFFHPSAAGTFMGLGVPFALRRWNQKRTVFRTALLLVIAGGLLVNATRGVWVGVAVACVLLLPNPAVLVTSVVPVTAVLATVAYLIFKNTAAMHRLVNPNDLLSRIDTWRLGLRVFESHPVFGVGQMQFQKVYLGYVQDFANAAHFNLKQVHVIDNMFLTVLVAHGVVGLLALLGLFTFVLVALRKARKRLLVEGATARASLIRAAELSLVVYAVTGCFADVNLFTKATKYIFILIGLGFAMAKTERPDLPRAAPSVS